MGPEYKDHIEHCINSSVCTINATYPFELTLLRLIDAADGILFLSYHKQLPPLQSRHHQHSANK